MSYQVLARKWRPRRFQEMVGQQHVLRALINALDQNRLHHAYLFTGTRGVGKTTIARIFAKSLNCETGVSSQPCGQCGSCREVDEGRFVDLIEVDAASRTRVEDTRELLENVQYAPTRGRYKVYLIDEVHMLSNSSFNALLKTLEEPPPHVKFLLATTDPQRLPVTILSRCLQFNLKRLSKELIADHLQYILTQEKVVAEPSAIVHIAQAADGSMRDGLSLLDQAIAYGGGELRDDEVRAMLGSVDRAHVVGLARALAAKQPPLVLAAVAEVAERAPDFSAVLAELLSLLHRVALAQCVPGAVGADAEDGELVIELAQQMSAEDVQLYYQIALLGRRDLPLAPDARSSIEMTLLRMLTFTPDNTAAKAASAATKVVSTPAPTPNVRVVAPAAARAVPAPVAPTPASSSREYPASAPTAARPTIAESAAVHESTTPASAVNWSELIKELRLDGFVRQLAANCALLETSEQRWTLSLSTPHASLYNKKLEERLRAALEQKLGRSIVLDIKIGAAAQVETPAMNTERVTQEKLRAAQQAIHDDANVKALVDTFNGRVIANSIQPID